MLPSRVRQLRSLPTRVHDTSIQRQPSIASCCSHLSNLHVYIRVRKALLRSTALASTFYLHTPLNLSVFNCFRDDIWAAQHTRIDDDDEDSTAEFLRSNFQILPSPRYSKGALTRACMKTRSVIGARRRTWRLALVAVSKFAA
ncbi:hypothetical protein F441_15678 [Phytophthora nicotianae CJ01A1]|uniref:Uncharacterized protein n=6 Tax=Phytophthora nicotianae TaxID=4792 RepID=W2R2L8_PHYN3|nr:hypothetical protein PPTG_21475 [Phytophthora nicotianae INRA-310]ETI38396.1 hypothetical protein F443_15845 [Phytophthora nicotianae P1569]ETK78601.1 hypothetical protein L915_15401 [Phytophthora nicotianae]ETO67171.1 hypothetical protein F444_15825 [Phytophthora nicotianae P1976]ETP08353.1 hypothetical protein F441_15678 [Phytophthora nicotianae CJ01A1]ETP36405.1 hypothetical protein F442_15686 [Phytophthora nicotianae P10297]